MGAYDISVSGAAGKSSGSASMDSENYGKSVQAADTSRADAALSSGENAFKAGEVPSQGASSPQASISGSKYGDPQSQSTIDVTKAWGGLRTDKGFYGHYDASKLYTKHQIRTTGRV